MSVEWINQATFECDACSEELALEECDVQHLGTRYGWLEIRRPQWAKALQTTTPLVTEIALELPPKIETEHYCEDCVKAGRAELTALEWAVVMQHAAP